MPWYEVTDHGQICYSSKIVTKKRFYPYGTVNPSEICEIINRAEDPSVANLPLGIYADETKETSRKVSEPPSGYYSFDVIDDYPKEEILRPITVRNDKYISVPSSADQAKSEILEFIRDADWYGEQQILHKRGMLLYGPPGEGKTAFLRNLLKEVIPKESLVIHLTMLPSRKFIKTLGDETGNRLKVFVFEEFATLTQDPKQIRAVLDFLDGETSINHSLVIATTNHPELIPGNVVDRPSRFDCLIKFGDPNAEARKILLNSFLKREITAEEVSLCNKLSTAAIKEACIRSLSKKMSLEAVFKELKIQSELVKSDFAAEKKLGFRRYED